MNTSEKIIIASDHRGFSYKEYIKKLSSFAQSGNVSQVSWIDVGAFTDERTDYPLFAQQAIQKMHQDAIGRAVLICGSGNGMAMTANRFKGIYACVAWNKKSAQASKEDDNCNVLVLPADYIKQEEIIEIISSWLSCEFKKGRYAERLALIDALQ